MSAPFETEEIEPLVFGWLRSVVGGRLNVGGVLYEPASRELLAQAKRIVTDCERANAVVRNGIVTAVTLQELDVVRGVLDAVRDDAVNIGGRWLVVAARISGDDFAEMIGRLVEARIDGGRVVTVRELAVVTVEELEALRVRASKVTP